MNNSYVIKTKEFARNYEVKADYFVLVDDAYKLFIKDPSEEVASIPKENVLLLSKKANLATD